MTGYIYIHINKINGKKYVGQTTQKPEDRWGGGTNYKNSPYFYNAIKKYGWNNFEHEVIPAFEEELDFLEEKFIEKYDTMNPEKGYNRMTGGSLNRHMAPFTQEHKNKIGASRKDKPRSKETKEKISNTLKGRKFNRKTNNKKVLCIETNKIYLSASIAAKEIGINRCSVSKSIKNNYRAGGYHWRYIE